MPLKQLDAPCWVIACPDGTLAGQWDEHHFSDEDEAADTLGCERDKDAAYPDDLAPHPLESACLVIVCDGCGKGYSSEDSGGTDHFISKRDAAWHSGDVEFRDDGTTWCEECQ